MITHTLAAARRWLENNRGLMWLFTVVGGASIHILLWQVSAPPFIFNDFYKAYWEAGEYLWYHGLGASWPPAALEGNWSNLPVFGWLFAPLVPLGEENAAWFFSVLGLAAAIGAWKLAARLARLNAPSSAALLFLFLVNGPLVNSLREGNSTHFVLFLLVTAMLLLRSQREFSAGVMLGICATIKPPLLLFGVYFLLRRRWPIVIGGACAVGGAGLLSIAIFGLDGNIQWYEHSIVPFLGTYVAAFNNQSIDGFLIRLVTGETRLHNWLPLPPTTGHRVARLGIFAAIYGSMLWLTVRANRSPPELPVTGRLGRRELLMFAVVLNVALLTSPISWTHYYLFLLLPIALYFGGMLPFLNFGAASWLMRIGLAFVSLPVIVPQLESSWIGEILSRTVISAWLFGGVLLHAALVIGAWRATRRTVF